jgi:hypothetical protein
MHLTDTYWFESFDICQIARLCLKIAFNVDDVYVCTYVSILASANTFDLTRNHMHGCKEQQQHQDLQMWQPMQWWSPKLIPPMHRTGGVTPASTDGGKLPIKLSSIVQT